MTAVCLGAGQRLCAVPEYRDVEFRVMKIIGDRKQLSPAFVAKLVWCMLQHFIGFAPAGGEDSMCGTEPVSEVNARRQDKWKPLEGIKAAESAAVLNDYYTPLYSLFPEDGAASWRPDNAQLASSLTCGPPRPARKPPPPPAAPKKPLTLLSATVIPGPKPLALDFFACSAAAKPALDAPKATPRGRKRKHVGARSVRRSEPRAQQLQPPPSPRCGSCCSRDTQPAAAGRADEAPDCSEASSGEAGSAQKRRRRVIGARRQQSLSPEPCGASRDNGETLSDDEGENTLRRGTEGSNDCPRMRSADWRFAPASEPRAPPGGGAALPDKGETTLRRNAEGSTGLLQTRLADLRGGPTLPDEGDTTLRRNAEGGNGLSRSHFAGCRGGATLPDEGETTLRCNAEGIDGASRKHSADWRGGATLPDERETTLRRNEVGGNGLSRMHFADLRGGATRPDEEVASWGPVGSSGDELGTGRLGGGILKPESASRPAAGGGKLRRRGDSAPTLDGSQTGGGEACASAGGRRMSGGGGGVFEPGPPPPRPRPRNGGVPVPESPALFGGEGHSPSNKPRLVSSCGGLFDPTPWDSRDRHENPPGPEGSASPSEGDGIAWAGEPCLLARSGDILKPSSASRPALSGKKRLLKKVNVAVRLHCARLRSEDAHPASEPSVAAGCASGFPHAQRAEDAGSHEATGKLAAPFAACAGSDGPSAGHGCASAGGPCPVAGCAGGSILQPGSASQRVKHKPTGRKTPRTPPPGGYSGTRPDTLASGSLSPPPGRVSAGLLTFPAPEGQRGGLQFQTRGTLSVLERAGGSIGLSFDRDWDVADNCSTTPTRLPGYHSLEFSVTSSQRERASALDKPPPHKCSAAEPTKPGAPRRPRSIACLSLLASPLRFHGEAQADQLDPRDRPPRPSACIYRFPYDKT
ncbi:hypothetical protein DIPPA_15666 [Diplonema papillatum]|nr:hypothetical protein DIPPA_16961 [Diplonema papillatum]KAJ9440263.1 hypothetical protein DIPPA_15666 [Diplonema papillatum]